MVGKQREVSPEMNSPGTLILNFQPLEPWKKKMCIKTPSLQYFVMAAKPDQYIDTENAGVPIVAKR